MCCYRRRKKLLHSDSKTLCNTPENSLIQKIEPPTSSIQQQITAGGGGTENNNNASTTGKVTDQKIQPIGSSNPQPLPPSSTPTPKTQTPKRTSRETAERTVPGTVEDTKSKLASTQSQIPQVETAPQRPRQAPLKVEKKSVVVHKGSGGAPKSHKRKMKTQSKRIDGKPDESEHFEEGEDKSREDISVDDTLKGIGTEMPHFES